MLRILEQKRLNQLGNKQEATKYNHKGDTRNQGNGKKEEYVIEEKSNK